MPDTTSTLVKITFIQPVPIFLYLTLFLCLFGLFLPHDLLIRIIYVSNSSAIEGQSRLLETVPFSPDFSYKCHTAPARCYRL